MKVKLGDDLFDMGVLTFPEAIKIKKKIGQGATAFTRGLLEGDPESTLALLWVLKSRVDPTVRYETLLNTLSLDSFEFVLEDEDNDEEDEDSEDPKDQSTTRTTPRKRTSKKRPVSTATLPGAITQ